ncbi:unnamed protein product [Rotaria sp. Silwood2]|nr:unnamed protein product [Rotaria sp. Silwood2]
MTDNIEKQLTDATQSPHLFMKEDDVAMTKRYYKMLTREALQLQDIPASTISQLCSYSYSNLANEIYHQYAPQLEFNDKALNRSQHELKVRLDLTPLQRANLLYTIGLCFIRKGVYIQALHSLSEAEKIYNDNRLSYDDYVRKFLVHLYLKNYLKALTMWKKGIDIRSCFRGN